MAKVYWHLATAVAGEPRAEPPDTARLCAYCKFCNGQFRRIMFFSPGAF